MKKITILILLLITLIPLHSEEILTRADGTKVVIFNDNTWTNQDDGELKTNKPLKNYKSFLRDGVKASDNQILIACEIYSQGWVYVMPRPKSSQASWGNWDGRTTWYNGYWHNAKTNLYSNTTPIKKKSGLYLGDNQNYSNTWRNGGTPPTPDVYMFLLSNSGGPTLK